jgi:hypothetical protein
MNDAASILDERRRLNMAYDVVCCFLLANISVSKKNR